MAIAGRADRGFEVPRRDGMDGTPPADIYFVARRIGRIKIATAEGTSSMSDEKTGQARLFDALTTKGIAFTHAERLKLGLLGLLPPAEKTLEEQVDHCWREFSAGREDIDKHIYLRALQDR